MRHSIESSLRAKLALYAVAALALALLTEAGFGVLLYILSALMGSSSNGYGYRGNKGISGRVGIPGDVGTRVELGQWLHRLWRLEPGTIYSIIAAVLIMGILLFVVYFLFFTRGIMRDLSDISVRITNITRGSLSEHIEVTRQDEIGEIAFRVNEMTQEIIRLMNAEREALQVNKDLIACVAHDLRTPLTSVIGYLNLAMDTERYSVEQRQQYARIALDKANRLGRLIQDLFDYTKLMSGEMPLHRQNIDLVKLIEQLLEEFYPIFQDNALECQFTKNVDRLELELDSELVARAVQNLLSNAVKYGRDGKRVLLTLEQMEREVQVTVTNYGLIIPKEELEMIFEKFYRVEESRSHETGGSGLGLNIAKEIMELHGGTISVESGEQGTIFTAALPL